MTRVRKDQRLQKQMCERLIELLDDCLHLSDADAARALGYQGTATLWRIRRGTAFVDVERLAILASLGQEGARPNLHWLLTGRGPRLIAATQTSKVLEIVSLVARLSPQKQRAILTLISPARGNANPTGALKTGPRSRN